MPSPDAKPTLRTRNGSLGPPSVCVRGLIWVLELVWGSLRWFGVQNVSGAWRVHMGVAKKSGYSISGARVCVGAFGSGVWAAVAVVALLRRFALCFRTLDGPEQQGFLSGRFIDNIACLY